MLTERPCGECRALVPADTGCPHWRPDKAERRAAKSRAWREAKNTKHRMTRAEARKRAKIDRDEALAEFQRMMQGGS